jgi:hypothetical protein
VCLGGCAGRAAAGVGAAARRQGPSTAFAATHVFAPTDEEIPNPERGFYRQFMPFGPGLQQVPLDDQTLAEVRREGLSLVRAYFVIDEFSGTPLSRAALDDIASAFAAVRRAGLKVIPRFAYNFPSPTDYQRAQDAPLERVLGHLDQLAPVLAANADVIAFVEAGFVGAWGEWHTSSSGLLESDRSLNGRSAAILARLLAIVPPTRAIALRYPFHKQQLYGLQPLGPRDAFTGAPQARVGAHNDCFTWGATNGGTYAPPPRLAQSVEALKRFLELDNRWVPQGGESCADDVTAAAVLSPEAHCASAVPDLARMHWSTLHVAYHPGVIGLWQREGCFGEIRKRLGYRFRLVDASLPARAVAGRPWSVSLRLTNDGWAAPYNPRLVELVLRDVATGALARFPLAADPRFWGPGETQILQFSATFPPLDQGDYELLLHLPDPERGLYGVPAYSIRLANSGLWEPDTGFNALRARLSVVPAWPEGRTGCVDADDRPGGRERCTGR